MTIKTGAMQQKRPTLSAFEQENPIPISACCKSRFEAGSTSSRLGLESLLALTIAAAKEEDRLTERKALIRWLKDAVKYRLFRQTWNIAAISQPVTVVAGLAGAIKQRDALASAAWMVESRGAFRADPFPFREVGDAVELLFEELCWEQGRGTIASAFWDGAKFELGSRVLDLPHHLSYPFVVGDGFVPEQSAAQSVVRYRRTGQEIMPTPLLDGLPIVDPTFVHHEGRWWLFGTHLGPTENSALHLYHSNAIEGPWLEHPLNPVKIDQGSARPAGPLFFHKGDIFRPAQNCRNHYGESISICRISKISTDVYVEEIESEVVPISEGRYNYGLHTLSGYGDMTLIDGSRLESIIHPFFDFYSKFVR